MRGRSLWFGLCLLGALIGGSLTARAEVSPLPTGAGLAYVHPVKGDAFGAGIVSWQLTDRPVLKHIKLDMLIRAPQDGNNTLIDVVPGLGVDIVNPGKALHLGATALLSSDYGHFAWYASLQLVGSGDPVIQTFDGIPQVKTLGLSTSFGSQGPRAEFTWTF